MQAAQTFSLRRTRPTCVSAIHLPNAGLEGLVERSRDHALLCADRLVGVVGLAVGEEIVDDHADNGEEEDNENPDDLARNGAVGLEDFDCDSD
jgi:hypothetical protein